MNSTLVTALTIYANYWQKRACRQFQRHQNLRGPSFWQQFFEYPVSVASCLEQSYFEFFANFSRWRGSLTLAVNLEFRPINLSYFDHSVLNLLPKHFCHLLVSLVQQELVWGQNLCLWFVGHHPKSSKIVNKYCLSFYFATHHELSGYDQGRILWFWA